MKHLKYFAAALLGITHTLRRRRRTPPRAHFGARCTARPRPLEAELPRAGAVLQSWLAACGRPHDVVVGVRKVGDEFPRVRMDRRRRAGAVGDFEEIARLSPLR